MQYNEKTIRTVSKFLSLVLRHQPQSIGIQLDKNGWTKIEELLKAMSKRGMIVSREDLEYVVATNDKRRFVISDDGVMIRPNQGHSVDVELGYLPAEPPETLLHGTPSSAVEIIRREGLKKMNRHHVHLHVDHATAETVGARRGRPVLLRILSKEMSEQGFLFYVTANEVWLTDHVPPQFIEFPAES